MTKEKVPVGLLVLIGGLIIIGASAAFAGDDPVFNLPMSLDAGSNIVCSQKLLANKHYSVQPTVNSYVAVSTVNDGGTQSADGGTGASARNVEVESKKLYDVWTTTEQIYICCKPAADGAESNCKGFLYREGMGP